MERVELELSEASDVELISEQVAATSLQRRSSRRAQYDGETDEASVCPPFIGHGHEEVMPRSGSATMN